MRFCFIVEEQYRHERMPLAVAEQLRAWHHDVDLLEPHDTVTCLSAFARQGRDAYDAYVLKTVSDGPGLSILAAADAAGIRTINSARAIRLVRDKAVAAACARARGLPIPMTYFVAHPRLLAQIPPEAYPLVVKPSNGSSCRGIYRLNSPADLATLQMADASSRFFLAQSYVENTGFDIKLYVIGTQVYAIAKKSPLQPGLKMREGPVPVTADLRKLALDVGQLFGLEIFGVDVVETPHGWVGLDINDFPSFGLVPGAIMHIADHMLHITRRPATRCSAPLNRIYRPLATRWDGRPRGVDGARVRSRLQRALHTVSAVGVPQCARLAGGRA